MTNKSSNTPILILGSGSNIGLFLAKRLIEDGRRVILSYRSKPDEVIKLQMDNPKLVLGAFVLDARSTESIDLFFYKVLGITDKLSAVINTIGSFLQKPLLETSDEEFEQVLYSNLVQAFAFDRRCFPLLKANKSGQIIHFTFAGTEKISAYSESAAYAASKLGLLSIIRSLSVEWAAHNITVNSIAPGITEIVPESQRKLLDSIPQKRFTKLEEIYQAARYLLSDGAASVTGTNITVSGGFGWRYP